MGWAQTIRPDRSAQDAFSLMIGDTNASDHLHFDEEAEYYLGNSEENEVLWRPRPVRSWLGSPGAAHSAAAPENRQA
jgi:hypothetical protein